MFGHNIVLILQHYNSEINETVSRYLVFYVCPTYVILNIFVSCLKTPLQQKFMQIKNKVINSLVVKQLSGRQTDFFVDFNRWLYHKSRLKKSYVISTVVNEDCVWNLESHWS